LELPADANAQLGNRISLSKLIIDGVEKSSAGQFYEKRETRMPVQNGVSQYPVEFGVIKIPVNLSQSHSRCKIDLVLKLESGFPRIFAQNPTDKGDFYAVDIPYVTRYVRAKIFPPPGYIFQRLAKDEFVEAISVVVGENRDPDESNLQSDGIHFTFSEDCLEWATDTAKLGYRYRIRILCKR